MGSGQSDAGRLFSRLAELLAQFLGEVAGLFQFVFGRLDRLGQRLQFLGQPRVLGRQRPQQGMRLDLHSPGVGDGPFGFQAAGLVERFGQPFDVLLRQRDLLRQQIAFEPHQFDGVFRLVARQAPPARRGLPGRCTANALEATSAARASARPAHLWESPRRVASADRGRRSAPPAAAPGSLCGGWHGDSAPFRVPLASSAAVPTTSVPQPTRFPTRPTVRIVRRASFGRRLPMSRCFPGGVSARTLRRRPLAGAFSELLFDSAACLANPSAAVRASAACR